MALGDTTLPRTDAWWLQRLWDKLQGRYRRTDRLARYLAGDPPMVEGMDNVHPAVIDLFRTSRSNFAELVVEAPRERMQFIGIRTDPAQGETGDLDAWDLWRECGCPVEAADVHQTMLALGDAYVMVGWDDEDGLPIVTSEDPRQVVTIHDPRQQRKVLAAAKFFHDPEANQDFGYLFVRGSASEPARMRVAYRDRVAYKGDRMSFDPTTWSWVDGGQFLDVLGPKVPVVRFRNRRGVGEFEPHTDLLDRINRMILRRMVIATFQAFRQRAVMGELAERDEAGNEIDWSQVLQAGPDALWLLPPDVKLWESGQVDLTPILSSVKDDVLHLAAVTRTPLPMLTPDAVAQSAEGASFQREGLVFKTKDRIGRAEAAWVDVLDLMFRFAGRGVNVAQIRPLWAPVEQLSLAEKGSAWAQFQGLPFSTKVRTVLQVTTDEAARIASEQQDEQLQLLISGQQAQQQAPQPPAA